MDGKAKLLFVPYKLIINQEQLRVNSCETSSETNAVNIKINSQHSELSTAKKHANS